jgi:mevalonate kinase
MTLATAPGKAILFGEHAVVYGRPAIAVPLWEVCATAEVFGMPGAPAGAVIVEAPDVGLAGDLAQLDSSHPIARIILDTLGSLGPGVIPALHVRVTSTIPIAAGMGSGAAVSVAIARALGQHLGRPLSADEISALAFAVERIHHGTPSGIDNTVIAFGQPVYFRRGAPPIPFSMAGQMHLVLGDTGVASPTAAAVSLVRERWRADPATYEKHFDALGQCADQARALLEAGRIAEIGPLMDTSHRVLKEIGVSSAGLDRLVRAARNAGAWGAKLSGAGRGGSMLALAPSEDVDRVRQALTAAGAVRTICAQVGP